MSKMMMVMHRHVITSHVFSCLLVFCLFPHHHSVYPCLVLMSCLMSFPPKDLDDGSRSPVVGLLSAVVGDLGDRGSAGHLGHDSGSAKTRTSKALGQHHAGLHSSLIHSLTYYSITHSLT